ncbi:MAG: cation:proton antiporter [Gemmatimonadaceae bacterium]
MSALLVLILQIAVILLAARVVGGLFRKIGQPQVVGEMVAGIVLGPSVLGWVAPRVFATVFPASSLGALNALSQLGLLLFMFLVGLEFDPSRLRGRGDAALLTSHASIIAPFLLGTALALITYPQLSDASVSFVGFALFSGAAMSVTAFPVLARILTERNMSRTRLGSVAIACAAVDDVSAWTLLAIVVVIVRASAADVALWVTIGGASLYVAVMFFVVRRGLRLLESYFLSRGKLTQDMVAIVVIALLLSAWMTERLGIHALFGAFAMGAVMPKHPRFIRDLAAGFEDLTVVLLLPLFFAFTGLRTSIGLLQGTHAWSLFGLVLLAAVAGKFGGSAIASRLTGLGWRESAAVGILMNTRGLMELVILSIGLDLGVISPELFAMMVLMALVTTFMTAPVLDLLYPARVLEQEGAVEPTAPPERAGSTAMLAISLPSAGPGLLRAAIACAGPAGLRQVYAVHLIRAGDALVNEAPERAVAELERTLAPVLAEAARLNVRLTVLQFVSRDIARDLADLATVKGAHMLFVGWHKPVVSRSLVSGTVRELLAKAPCDVIIHVDRTTSDWRRVLVPYAGGRHDVRAVEFARRISAATEAPLTLLRTERAEGMPAAERIAREHTVIVPAEHPLPAFVAEVRRDYDLVVVGVSPTWGTDPAVFSPREEAIVATTAASLLVVRAGAKAAPDTREQLGRLNARAADPRQRGVARLTPS